MLRVDEWLRERRPAPDLAGLLVRVWRGDLGSALTPVPDACIDLVWMDDGSMWVVGPESRSWCRGYQPGTIAVGAGFAPGTGPPVLRMVASELRDARVRLEEVWGQRAARELAERVGGQPDDARRALVLEDAVRRLGADAAPADRIVLAVAAGLGSARPASVRELASATSLSERQLHRRCTAVFGYGPAVLARILRIQRVLGLARIGPRLPRLADLAAAAGYSDQQHLAHDIKALFGTTPRELMCPIDTRRGQSVSTNVGV